MPELRKDPLVKRWVVMAPERAERPVNGRGDSNPKDEVFDPFLEGNESATTAEVFAFRHADSTANGPGWQVRVVPNKYPALRIEGGANPQYDGIYEKMDGIGAHEVIIECPHNETNLSRLNAENIGKVLTVYRDRLRALKQDPRLLHAVIFKNKGILAGASLPHSHSQLIATPVIPTSICEELEGAQAFFNVRGRSIFLEMIDQELAAATRIVLHTERFVVVCPFASRFPYEMCILPKKAFSHFENISEDDVTGLATVLKTVLRKLERALDDPPYNYVLHTAPFDPAELPYYSWHIDVFPRLTRVAGFEWGSGFYINEVLPETAASILRAVSE